MEILIIWLLCGFVGFLIGEKKNRPALGAVLGVLLGIFGVIIIAVLEPKVEEPEHLPSRKFGNKW